MERRRLGRSDLTVSAIGLGCMSMSQFYGRPDDDAESLATLARAVDLGVDFFDTAISYENGRNEEIVGRGLAPWRRQVAIATKFGVYITHDGKVGYSGDAEYARQCCDASLYRLKTDVIDLWYLHRVDPKVPIEDSVGAMARMVAAGKVRALGLCEVNGQTLARANAVHPIAAVQSEYSLWTRNPEAALLAACRRLGVALVPFSPLGRGFFTGTIRSKADFRAGDRRAIFPRFADANLARNLALLDVVEGMAREKGCTPGQLALAWVLAQGADIVPIPGTRQRRYLEENVAAAAVVLTADDRARLDAAFPPGVAEGERLPAMQMPYVDL